MGLVGRNGGNCNKMYVLGSKKVKKKKEKVAGGGERKRKR